MRPAELEPAAPKPINLGRKRLLIFIVAYNAESTIQKVLSRIPPSLQSDQVEVLIIDDSSKDDTFLNGLRDVVEPVGSGLYRFRKSLFGEVCYEHLPYRRRRVLHQLAGEAIVSQVGSGTSEVRFSRTDAGRKEMNAIGKTVQKA